MRKLFALTLVLMLTFGCAAWAESDSELFEYSFGDFSMMLPGDLEVSIADTIEESVPFFYFYEDYDPEADINANLNCVWSEDMIDIDSAEPTAIAQSILNDVVQQLEAMDIGVEDPTLYGADYVELNGKRALLVVYSNMLNYSALDIDIQCLNYTLQMIVPIENCSTYTFTITAEDLLECERLIAILKSIEWLV